MIIAYGSRKQLEPHTIQENNLELLEQSVWIDLINPTAIEEKQVEDCLQLDIPTREEMRAIELSSRLYKNDDALFMTATMLAQSNSIEPQLEPVTFVLTKQKLITVRYVEPTAFKLFISSLPQYPKGIHHPTALLIALLDATIDRTADILQVVSQQLEAYSKTIFQPTHTAEDSKFDYQYLMQKIGLNAALNSKVGESLITFNRLITFLSHEGISSDNSDHLSLLVTQNKDINALSDHAHFLSNKTTFLLDATLGMINIEQNAIIKIFSVAAVIFLPPTLIASIYGMNFKFIPELSWKYGYGIAIISMLLAAWLPYKYFKHRKWL